MGICPGHSIRRVLTYNAGVGGSNPSSPTRRYLSAYVRTLSERERCLRGRKSPRINESMSRLEIPPSSDSVELVDYDSSWPSRFEAVVTELKAILGPNVHRLEHVGSTAVPGLVAKPIIDVLVEVEDDDAARTVAVPQLLKAGYYECYWRFDSPPGHFQCVKRDTKSFKRLVHVHLIEPSHPMWGTVAFRDLLRTHPEELARYAKLKRDLAARFPDDREAYTSGKTELVTKLTKRALAERSDS
jgi:GrpB-like predicted nucleotidyltransferase (UPF0157 family)